MQFQVTLQRLTLNLLVLPLGLLTGYYDINEMYPRVFQNHIILCFVSVMIIFQNLWYSQNIRRVYHCIVYISLLRCTCISSGFHQIQKQDLLLKDYSIVELYLLGVIPNKYLFEKP